MLCDWCDESIADDDYSTVWFAYRRDDTFDGDAPLLWVERHYHDGCRKDGTRGYLVIEDNKGELIAMRKLEG